MSVLEDIRDRLIEIENTITTERGETGRGALFIPPHIATNDVPIIINIWRGTRKYTRWDRHWEIVRVWDIHCVFEEIGVDLYSADENRTAEWISAFGGTFHIYDRLQSPSDKKGLQYVTGVTILGDDGGSSKPYSGKEYYSIVFNFLITYEEICT